MLSPAINIVIAWWDMVHVSCITFLKTSLSIRIVTLQAFAINLFKLGFRMHLSFLNVGYWLQVAHAVIRSSQLSLHQRF